MNTEAMETAAKLVARITRPVGKLRAWTFNDKNAGVKALLQASPHVQMATVLRTAACFGQMANRMRQEGQFHAACYLNLSCKPDYPDVWVRMSNRLMLRKLAFSETDLGFLLEQLAAFPAITLHSIPIAENVIRAVEQYAAGGKSIEPFRKSLAAIHKALQAIANVPERKLRHRVQRLMDHGAPRIILVPGEAWSDAALADLKEMKPARRNAWMDLLAHCQSAAGGSPGPAWLKKSAALLKAANAKQHLLKWFPLVNEPRTERVLDYLPEYQPDPNQMIIEPHADLLKGLAWCAGLKADQDLAHALRALASSAYRKLPKLGPRAVKIGNACVVALGMMPGREGIYQLAVLKAKVKFRTAQKSIESAFDVAAHREQIPREDLEEVAVPSGANMGAKDMARMLAAQRERLDHLFLRQKTWAFPIWRERYLDHPLVGTLARRLIWNFTTGKRTCPGIWLDGRLVDVDLKPIAALKGATMVRLWHPIDRSTEEVMAWRARLEAQQIQQPFKQAHREVYVLTDAERDTGDYSNRFAAHILRQHQFNALCAARRWKNKLRLLVDDDFPPASRDLPEWNLRAEFSIEGITEDYDADTSPTGVFHFVATDHVRFCRLKRNTGAVPLERLPPLVFSEVMRDVDLFVGVASIGNDPTWVDGGPEERYRDYWQGYSFGELSLSAKTRKDVLQRLVPKLKIARQCSFEEKFLVVKGSLRTYRIHLGSGNILMEPNEYLCIVADRAPVIGDIFLPFEGDRTLSVILSKAFLLANDSKISDPAILNQIRSK